MYLKNKKSNIEWKKFLDKNREFFLKTDIPIFIWKNHNQFDYFLMHGYGYMDNLGSTTFGVDELSEKDKKILQNIIVDYLKNVYNPGLGIFGSEIENNLYKQAGIK